MKPWLIIPAYLLGGLAVFSLGCGMVFLFAYVVKFITESEHSGLVGTLAATLTISGFLGVIHTLDVVFGNDTKAVLFHD